MKFSKKDNVVFHSIHITYNMSKIKTTISLTPTVRGNVCPVSLSGVGSESVLKNMGKTLSHEVFISENHQCPACGGSGEESNNAPNPRDEELTHCHFCGGVGVIDAVVSIEWKSKTK